MSVLFPASRVPYPAGFFTCLGFSQRVPLPRQMLEAISAPVLVIQVRLLQSFDGGVLTPSQLVRPVRIVTDIPPGKRPLPGGLPQKRRKGRQAVRSEG